MSRGRASVLSPANQPLFEGQLIRNPTRVNRPGGGGGDPEFPFQWSFPGLVNYTAQSPKIWNINAKFINYAFYSFVTAPSTSVSFQIFVNNAFAFEVSGVNADGYTFIESGAIPDLAVVDCRLTSVGTGDAIGLWIGLTTYLLP